MQNVSHPKSSFLQVTACYIGKFCEIPTAERLSKANRQYYRESKLHYGLPQGKYKECAYGSEGYGLQDLCKTDSRVDLINVGTRHVRDNHNTEMVQRRVAVFVTRDYRLTSSVTSIMHQLGWGTLQRRRELDHDVQNSTPACRHYI